MANIRKVTSKSDFKSFSELVKERKEDFMSGQKFSVSLERVSVLEILQHCLAQLVCGLYMRQDFAEISCGRFCYNGPEKVPCSGPPKF